MNTQTTQQNTPAWNFFVWVSFVISLLLMVIGIYHLPVQWWTKGYLAMGLFFLVSSCFSLAKTLRDNHEAEKFINRITNAKTEKLISNYEPIA